MIGLIGSLAVASKWAIVVPYHHQVVTPTWEHQICSANYSSSTALVLFVARRLSEHASPIDAFNRERWRCFNNVYITSGNLTEEENVYNKGGNDVDPWWNRGPNHAFVNIVDYVVGHNYSKFFLMEKDTVPQRDNWLDELEEWFDLDNYYILGGGIGSGLREAWVEYGMPQYYINHINGNAIYAVDTKVARSMLQSLTEYIMECWACGSVGKSLFPYFLSSRMSFDIYLSYLYQMIGFNGYVEDSSFLSNNAGEVNSAELNQTSLFTHQNSGFTFSRASNFDTVNLTGSANKNVCDHKIPGRPFLIIDDNSFDADRFVPTTTKDIRYVLNALPRNSSYCTVQCLEETAFCSESEECYYISTETVVYWPLDAYIECATRGELPHGSEYVSMHSDRYVLLDRSKVIVEHPVSGRYTHVPALGSSAGKPLSDAELAGIIGGSVGGVLLCCCLGYLCRRRK
jgi:hypothetical protein